MLSGAMLSYEVPNSTPTHCNPGRCAQWNGLLVPVRLAREGSQSLCGSSANCPVPAGDRAIGHGLPGGNADRVPIKTPRLLMAHKLGSRMNNGSKTTKPTVSQTSKEGAEIRFVPNFCKRPTTPHNTMARREKCIHSSTAEPPANPGWFSIPHLDRMKMDVNARATPAICTRFMRSLSRIKASTTVSRGKSPVTGLTIDAFPLARAAK